MTGIGLPGPGSSASLPARNTATRGSAAPTSAHNTGAAPEAGAGGTGTSAFEASNLAAMSPEDLLDELALRAAQDTTEHFPYCDNGDHWRDCQDCRLIHARCRSVLAAVLPAHEAMVLAAHGPEIAQVARDRVAQELRHDAAAMRRIIARKPSEHDAVRLARAKALEDAADRIARGGQA